MCARVATGSRVEGGGRDTYGGTRHGDIVQRALTQSVHLVATNGQTDRGRRGHVNRLAGLDLRPDRTVGGMIGGETVARADQLDPPGRSQSLDAAHRRRSVRTAPPLEHHPALRRDQNRRVRRSSRRALPNHHARLCPIVGVLLRGHPRHDAHIPVGRLIHVAERVGCALDIRTRTGHREDTVSVIDRAGRSHRTDIRRLPRRGQIGRKRWWTRRCGAIDQGVVRGGGESVIRVGQDHTVRRTQQVAAASVSAQDDRTAGQFNPLELFPRADCGAHGAEGVGLRTAADIKSVGRFETDQVHAGTLDSEPVSLAAGVAGQVRNQISGSVDPDKAGFAASIDSHGRVVGRDVEGGPAGRPVAGRGVRRPDGAGRVDLLLESVRARKVVVVGSQPLELHPAVVMAFIHVVVFLTCRVARPEFGAEQGRIRGAGLEQGDGSFHADLALVAVVGNGRVGPVDTIGREIIGPVSRIVNRVEVVVAGESHERTKQDQRVRRDGADRFVQRDLVVPIVRRPLPKRIGRRFVVRLVDDVRLVFVAWPVKIPEPLRPLQVHLPVLAVAADGDDEIETRIGTSLHQQVAGRRVVADGIVVPVGTGRVSLQIEVQGVETVGLGQSIELQLGRHDRRQAAVGVAAVKRDAHPAEQGLLVRNNDIKAETLIDLGTPPGAPCLSRQQGYPKEAS